MFLKEANLVKGSLWLPTKFCKIDEMLQASQNHRFSPFWPVHYEELKQMSLTIPPQLNGCKDHNWIPADGGDLDVFDCSKRTMMDREQHATDQKNN